jgi:NTE family protein
VGDDRPQEERLAEVGRFALEAKTGDEDTFVAGFAARLNNPSGWTPGDFRCTSIDAVSGEFKVWDRDSGVQLARAVASSCAVPGVFPPVTINDRRYFDGGLRSGSNADLASGSEMVVIIALAGGAAATSEPRVLLARQRLEAETRALRETGARVVEVIIPDEGSRRSFGLNMLDWRRTAEAVEEGYRQGIDEAARLRSSWS